jgi:hypothetical protein
MEHNENSESPDSPPPPELVPAQAGGSGFFYKDGREMPPTHPDHGPMHLLPRQEDGSFATYYYCSKAELYDAEVAAPPPRRQRRDGFTAERQEQFLEAVRGGASGREAARLVGISPTTAYNLYNSADGAAFRAAWDEAARVTDIVLEDTAFDRAVNGQEEIVYHQGERVGVRWKYDNNLLMKLLRARNPLKYAPLSELEGWLRHRGIAPPPDADGALDRLRAAEAEWGRRLPGEAPLPRLADRTGAVPQPVRPDAPKTVRPELEACPERLPQAGSRRGPSVRSQASGEDGPSTGSGRTEGAAAGTAPLCSASSSEAQPIASTSLDNEQAEDAAVASTSSTSSESGQAADAVASTSSTSLSTDRPEDPEVESTSSTSSESGQAGNAPPPAEAPDGTLVPYYPPPIPRIFLAP